MTVPPSGSKLAPLLALLSQRQLNCFRFPQSSNFQQHRTERESEGQAFLQRNLKVALTKELDVSNS